MCLVGAVLWELKQQYIHSTTTSLMTEMLLAYVPHQNTLMGIETFTLLKQHQCLKCCQVVCLAVGPLLETKTALYSFYSNIIDS